MEGKKQIFMEPFLLCCYIFCTPLNSYGSSWLSISRTGSRLTQVTNYTHSCPHLGLVLHLQPCWNFGIKGVISAPNSNQFGFEKIFCIIQEGEMNNCTLKADEKYAKTVKVMSRLDTTDSPTTRFLLLPCLLLTKLQTHHILWCICNLVSWSLGVEANWMQEALPTLLLFTGTPTFMSVTCDWCWYFHCENKYRRQHSEAIPCLAAFPTKMN